MNITSNYTPLESLLLFQSLRADGVDNINFGNISEQIKSIPWVRDAPTYNDDRLGPEALRELYLRLVKEEVKLDVDRRREIIAKGQNGDLSPGSRKRKLPSPPYSPNVQDAAQHKHLIPQLVTRLYARYRESTITRLRDCERRYDHLSHQKSGDTSSINGSGIVSAAPTETSKAKQGLSSAQDETPLTVRVSTSTRTDNVVVSPSQIQVTIPLPTTTDSRNGIHEQPFSTVDAPTIVPSSRNIPDTVKVVIPATVRTNDSSQKRSPSTPHSHPSSNQNTAPAINQSSYTNRVSPIASPAGLSTPAQSTLSRPSSSAHPVLPPPGDAQLHPFVQPAPTSQTSPSTTVPFPGPHYQQNAVRSTARQPSPHERNLNPAYPSPVAPQGYYQAPSIPDQRVPHSATPQRHSGNAYATQSSHVGGYQLQPFYLDRASQNQPHPQPQHNSRPYQTPQLVQQPSQSFPPPQPGVRTPATAPRPPARPHLLSEIVAALATPPRSQRRPLWKSERRDAPRINGTPPVRPQVEPLSPTFGRAKSPISRHLRISADILEPSSSRRPAREKTPNSVISSNAGDHGRRRRLRSQSVASTIGAGSANEDQESNGKRVIKPEPSTPAEDGDIPEDSSIATTSRGRRRRGTLQPPIHNKRKRGQSYSSTAEDGSVTAGSPPPRPQTILASRNLTKLSAALMNDINSHKHASYFAGPVRDRDAEGYSDFIKRPQDLKSIRAAIIAGTRSVAAAVSSLDSPDESSLSITSQKGSDNLATIEVERQVDFMPPKAIVNGVQLEKEIMRMFANAVMFNPGEDGLVADAREMFEDIEAKIRDWRGIERDTAAAAGDDDEDTKGKRRKL